MKPPTSTMRSSAPRSTIRSLMIGKALARHGSTTISAPSANLRMCSWHVAVPRCGPWAWPSIISEHVPQMPSRQSWSNTMASLPSAISRSLSTSSSSRNEASSLISSMAWRLEAPGVVGPVLAPDLERQVADRCTACTSCAERHL